VVTRVCVSVCVCLSAAVRPHYCTDPDVTWGRGRCCPLVVHYWADLQSGHGLRCYGNKANPSYKLASISRYDNIVRTVGWAGSARACGRRPAGDGGGAPKPRAAYGKWARPARRRRTGRRRGEGSQHYCGNLDCGLPLVAFWQQKANAKC